MAWVGRLFFFFFLYVGCTEAKLIPLTPGWGASASYANPYSFSNGNFYPLLTPSNTTITSSKSTFVLGLFSSDGSPTVTLIICLLPFNSSIVIDVWNFGAQIIQNGPVLKVSQDKSELQHIDENFKVLWSTAADASALSLTESGNLIVYNSRHRIIWQSFDHPTNTLLPGMTLKQGTNFTAANSSYPAAQYVDVAMEPSGLVLYSTSGGSPLPYAALAIDGTLDYNKAIQECGDSGSLSNSTSTLHFNATDTADYLFLQACSKSSKYILAIQQQSNFSFLRLDSDGNIRHYLWQKGNLKINFEFFGKNMRCTLPDICGSYGVCSGEGECNCPLQSSSSSLPAAFTSDSKTKGCRRTTALSCDASSMKNQIFLTLSNVTYFSNRYVVPLNLTKKNECLSSCLSNCSCLVAFYEDSANLSARACYHISNHVSSLRQISSDAQKNYLAYLKVQSSSQKKYSSISTTVIVIISVAAAAILGAIVGLITWCYFKNSKKEEESSPSDDFLILMPGVPHKFSMKELEDATSGFQNKLGEGGFGAVFSGKLKDGRSVAVKRLDGASATQGQKEFEAEVRTLGGIDHINLVRLYGFCIEGANRLLVYEWMSNGSLDQWLFVEDSDNKELPWISRMAIAMDTAQGLAYLHEGCSQPVLHLDIKPQNILLGEKFKAKVSDLGMAKLINQDVITMTVDKTASYLHNNSTFQITQARGTPGYLAPELFGDLIVGKKCDVYSYGIVLLQIISGKKVYGSFETGFLPSWVYVKLVSGNITEIVDPKLDGNFEHHKAEQVIKLACWCIHETAEQRPAMPQIIQMLQGKMEVPEPTLAEPQPIMKPPRNTNSDFSVISGGDPSRSMLVPR